MTISSRRTFFTFLAAANLFVVSSGANAASLTSAGALEFTLSTFASGFPNTGFCCGPLGIAFPTTGGVMVTDYPGNVRTFTTDTDNQNAASFPVAQNYGFSNAVGLTVSGGTIYMTQQGAGTLVKLNNDGTFNSTVATGMPAATGVATNPVTGHIYISTLGNNVIWDYNPGTGLKTPLVNASADGLTVNAAGTIVYGEVNGHIIGYSTANGSQVFDSGSIPGGPDGTAIGATGPLAGKLFVNTNGGTVVEVDIVTLAQTVIMTGGSRGDFVTVDPNGTLLLTQTDSILRLTPIEGTFEGTQTPVPAALPLFASGLGLLGFAGWRRRRKPAA